MDFNKIILGGKELDVFETMLLREKYISKYFTGDNIEDDYLDACLKK